MCDDCWQTYGAPRLDTPAVRELAQLVGVIYEHSLVGEPFYAHIDRWKLDGDSWTPFWTEEEPADEWRHAADKIAALVPMMSVEERASALARYEGWVVDAAAGGGK